MALTGEPSGPPRLAAGALASAAQGAGRVLATLAPEVASFRTFDWAALLGERAALAGLTRRGSVSAGGSARLLATRDGVLAINLPRDDDWRLVPAWLEASPRLGATNDDWREIARRVAGRATAPLVDRARLIGLAVAPAARHVPADRPFFVWSAASRTEPSGARRRLRMLDLTSLWAGPLATSLLSMCGIETLKIEHPARPDGARRGPTAFFDLMNAGKQSCALDLGSPHDRRRFERLLDHADIVVESARPRALAQLGYDATSWTTERAGRLWASITGYGRQNEWIAFGDDAAAAAGLAWTATADAATTSGWSAGTSAPSSDSACFCGDAIADPLAGVHTAAILLAFARSGRGGLVDLSLVDLAARSAHTPLDPSAAFVAASGDGWSLSTPSGPVAVRPPRARPGRGPAPPLRPATDAFVARWCKPRC